MAHGEELRSIDRYGRFVLLAVFVVLLGGRFTLDRLGAYPAFDLRWAGVVLIGFCCLAWATVGREKTQPLRLGPLLPWFVAWAGWMALSAFWAPPAAATVRSVTDMTILALLVLAGWGVAARVHRRVLGSLWGWLFVAGLLYFAGAIAAGPDASGRYSAFGGGPNVFVRVMALAVLASLFIAATKGKNWPLLALPLFLYGAYLSGSRGGLLGLIVVVVLGGAPLLRRMSSRTRGTIAMSTLVVVMLAPFLSWSWLNVMRDRFLVQTFQQRYDSGRSDILDKALHMFDENSIIGVGLDGFFALSGISYPHNLFVASAAEGGVIGLVLVLVALIVAAATLRRLRPLSADALGFALGAAFMLVGAMFSGDYYDSRFVWFLLGLAVIAQRKARQESNSETNKLDMASDNASLTDAEAARLPAAYGRRAP